MPFVILQVKLHGNSHPFWLSNLPWGVSRAGMALSCAHSRVSEQVVELEQASMGTHWPMR